MKKTVADSLRIEDQVALHPGLSATALSDGFLHVLHATRILLMLVLLKNGDDVGGEDPSEALELWI
jgi:hypothetical protein